MQKSFILIYLLHTSTCFEHYYVHPQEVKFVLVQHLVSSLSLGDCPVHRLSKESVHQVDIKDYYYIRTHGQQNIKSNNSTLHEDLRAFMIISRSNVLRVRNISAARCRVTQNTHFMFNGLFRKSCRL